jgi:hypothetical protein
MRLLSGDQKSSSVCGRPSLQELGKTGLPVADFGFDKK